MDTKPNSTTKGLLAFRMVNYAINPIFKQLNGPLSNRADKKYGTHYAHTDEEPRFTAKADKPLVYSVNRSGLMAHDILCFLP
jgi:hypothetical protein